MDLETIEYQWNIKFFIHIQEFYFIYKIKSVEICKILFQTKYFIWWSKNFAKSFNFKLY